MQGPFENLPYRINFLKHFVGPQSYRLVLKWFRHKLSPTLLLYYSKKKKKKNERVGGGEKTLEWFLPSSYNSSLAARVLGLQHYYHYMHALFACLICSASLCEHYVIRWAAFNLWVWKHSCLVSHSLFLSDLKWEWPSLSSLFLICLKKKKNEHTDLWIW